LSTFLALEPPARPGRYEARLVVESGEIGWRAGITDASAGGSCPIPLLTPHSRGGVVADGPLALGVEVPPGPNPEFMRRFELDAVPGHALLRAVGLGAGLFWINGIRVGEAVLEPAQTQYDKRVDYATYDVELAA
jgi:hypothetical protein